jgi:hypothetical protein
MKKLTEGLIPADFVTRLNANFVELASIRSVSPYTTITTSDDYVNLINTYFGFTVLSAGMSGLAFKNAIDNAFINAGCLVDVATPSVVWVDDFARITIIDSSGGIAQHEIYESKNGGAYTLAHTMNAGVLSYDYQTWQNANLNFKVRAKNGSIYSGYSSIVNIATPLVFKTDQTNLNDPINNPFQIQYVWVLTGYSITLSLGDGSSQVFNSDSNYATPNLIHTYTVAGIYYIIITGDTDKVTALFNIGGVGRIFGVLTKQILPSYSRLVHLQYCDFSGSDVSGWFANFPSTCTVIDISGCNMDGVIPDDFVWPAGIYDIHLDSNNFTGNPWKNGIPDAVRNLTCGGNPLISGDLSTFVPTPITNTYLSQISYNYCPFTGDLSGQSIAIGTTAIGIWVEASGCRFTKGYRGHFLNVYTYNFENNLFNTAEVDSILAYVDNYFTGGVVPVMNCVYKLQGTGMGIPSAVGLNSRTSILGKYTAAGKTCSILVNS